MVKRIHLKQALLYVVAFVVGVSPLLFPVSAQAAEGSVQAARSATSVNIDWTFTGFEGDLTDYKMAPIIDGVEQPAQTVGTFPANNYHNTLPNTSYRFKIIATTQTTTDPCEEMEPEDCEEEAVINSTETEVGTSNEVRYGLENVKVSAKLTTYNSISLSYNSVYGATSYDIYRSTKKTSGFKKIATATGTNYTNKKLNLYTTYYYKVRAVQKKGSSTFTKDSAVVSKRTILGRTSLKVSKTTYNSVKLAWTKADGATKYGVFRSTKKTSGFKQLVMVSGTSYTNKKLNTGTRYYYKVVPYRGKTKGAATKVVSAKPILGKSNVTKFSSQIGSVKLSWSKVSGASGYKVYRANSKNGKYKLLKTTNSRSYTNKKLGNNKTYYYKVKAYRKVSKKQVNSGSSAAFKIVTPRKEGTYKFSKATLVVLETGDKWYGEYTLCNNLGCSYSQYVNELFKNKAYVYIPAGHYLKFEANGKGKITLAGSYPVPAIKSSFSREGWYLVGFDIRPGTYEVEGLNYSYCVTTMFVCEVGWIVNREHSISGKRYLYLEAGDFLNIDIWSGKVIGKKL